MKEVLKSVLERLHYGEPQIFRNLCVVPLLCEQTTGPAYITLKEGLERQLVMVSEISERGSVPNLQVENNAGLPLVLVDGEELAGAKQNRIVNTTLMLAAHSTTRIPVSCTESGRWRYNSRRFADSGVMMSAKARYRKSARLLYNLKMRNAYNTEQSEVWRDIETLHGKHGTYSRTRAMKDSYLRRQRDMAAYLEAFPLQEGQCGMVVFHNGEVAAADYLSRPGAYRHLHEKLLKSHVIEAIAEEPENGEVADWLPGAQLFLLSLTAAREVTKHQPAGLGRDLRFEGENNSAAALEYEDTVIHLSAYAKAMTENPAPKGRTTREEPAHSDSRKEKAHRNKRRFHARMFERAFF